MEKAGGWITAFILFFVVITLFLQIGHHLARAEGREPSKAVFYVHWYDVGEAALEGLQGIKKIEKGFRNLKETNTVYYDPGIITIEKMEQALKKAQTYRGTVK